MSEKIEKCPQCAEKDRIILAMNEFFEDCKLMDTDPDEYNRKEDIRDYANAKKQIETMQTITFGSPINVLLLTDRLSGCAKGLQEYLQNSTDITVDLVNALEEAQQIIDQKPIDFLIIVGFLKHKKNYQSIEAVKKLNKYGSIIMYASIDCVIKRECAENGIRYIYHRHDPMDGFVNYMKKCYDEQTERLYREFSKETNEKCADKLREQVRLNAIQTSEREAEHNAQKAEQLRLKTIQKERRNKILSYCGIIALVIAVLGSGVFSWYLNGQSDNTKEYTYILQEHEGSLVVKASMDDENVQITFNKIDDNTVSTYKKTGVLTLENAIKDEIIHERQGKFGKSYVFVEQRILLYCLMELAAY